MKYQEVIKGSIIWWILGFSCIPLAIVFREAPSIALGFMIFGAWFVAYPMFKYSKCILPKQEVVEERE